MLPYGLVKTIKLKREVTEKERVTYAWFAPELNYLLVRLYQSKGGTEQFEAQLTAIDSDDVVEVQDQDSKVKRLNKTQIVKAVTAEKKQEEDELRYLINAYRTKSTNPRQVVGDDIVRGRHPSSYGDYLRNGLSYGDTLAG